MTEDQFSVVLARLDSVDAKLDVIDLRVTVIGRSLEGLREYADQRFERVTKRLVDVESGER